MKDTPEQIIATLKGFSERSKKRIENRKKIRKQIEDLYAKKDLEIFENKKSNKDDK